MAPPGRGWQAAVNEPVVRRRWRRTTLILAAVVALVAVGGFAASTLFWKDQPSATARDVVRVEPTPAPPPEPKEPVVLPVQQPKGQPPGTIRLPEGGTATLLRKELDSSGTLPIPNGVGEATWWGAGLDSPKGATVLAGHVNWKGAVGPFAELWNSEQQQTVTVVDDSGRPWQYRISEVLTVGKDDLPKRAADLFGQGGEHRLVLVTCGGRYVGGDTGYNENRIVVATPVA